MKELKKRGIHLVIAITMVLFLLPIYVNADEKYTVIFDLKGGSSEQPIEPIIASTWEEVYAQMPRENSFIPEIIKIHKEGFKFDDWYFDEAYTHPVTYEEEPTEHQITLYAKWTANTANEEMIDMSKVNLTIEDLIIGTEVTLEEDTTGSSRYGYIQKPSINIASSNKHVKVGEPIIGDGSEYVKGIIKEGKDYYIEVVLTPEEGYLFSWPTVGGTATMLINGKEVGEAIDYNLDEYDPERPIIIRSNYDASLRIKVSPVKEQEKAMTKDYSILEGADQTYISGKDLIIRASGELENFQKLLIDNKEVSEDNYTKKSGSTVVTIKSNYLSTLSAGKHEVTFVYNDGTVKTSLTISEKTNNPKTGDNMIIYLLTAIMSIVGFIALIIYKKKQTN